jgi:predicted oxidoreductase (fatty acid repression mutant protein)
MFTHSISSGHGAGRGGNRIGRGDHHAGIKAACKDTACHGKPHGMRLQSTENPTAARAAKQTPRRNGIIRIPFLYKQRRIFSMENAFLDALKRRRTQYALGRDLPLSHEAVTALIQESIKHSPSSFNSQSSRAVVLFDAHSQRLWDIAKDILRKIVPADAFAKTEQKLDSFAAGAGTVLFFEDQDVVRGMQEKFPLYAENFPIWSEQAGGMAQLAVWSTLANAGIGASLQHYNPLIDEAVAKEWNIPASWKLRAQMPFGSNQGSFSEKTFMDDAQRFRVHR